MEMIRHSFRSANNAGALFAVVAPMSDSHVIFYRRPIGQVIAADWALGVVATIAGSKVGHELIHLNRRERATVTEELAMARHVADVPPNVAGRVATDMAGVGARTRMDVEIMPLELPDVGTDVRASDAAEVPPNAHRRGNESAVFLPRSSRHLSTAARVAILIHLR